MNVKFYLALWAAKLARRLIRLSGRQGSHTPGQIARRIDPHFLSHLGKPEHIACVTGTNGKTTVSNMISDSLTTMGVEHARNTYGSNLEQGVIVSLLQHVDWRGRSKVKYGLFEVDEIASKTVFPTLKPDIVAITNLYRDSYRRNAHTDYIVSFINEAVPENSLMLLNADDLISAGVAPKNPRRYFSIPPMPHEKEETTAIINDLSLCPACSGELTFSFQRYHHIGQATCTACGLTNPQADYVLKQVTEGTMTIAETRDDTLHEYPRVGRRIVEMYNELTAVAVLREWGYEAQAIARSLTDVKVTESRFDEQKIGQRRLLVMLGKDQNPIATTRAFYDIGQMSDVKSAAVLVINQVVDNEFSSENIAWIYDVNFEYLNKPFIKRIGSGTPRYHDFEQRMLLAGIPPEKIVGAPDEESLAKAIEIADVDLVILITGTKNKPGVEKAKTIIKERLEALN